MKNSLLLFLLIVLTLGLFAQKDTSGKYQKGVQTIPVIKVNTVPDSANFTNENIKKNKPFMLVFFSPDCEHCQRETKELLAYKKELKGIQILMVSMASFKEIAAFSEAYGLSAMKNVKLGQDVNYKLGILYKLRTYPTMFLYDSKGMLAKSFIGNTSVPAILEAVK